MLGADPSRGSGGLGCQISTPIGIAKEFRSCDELADSVLSQKHLLVVGLESDILVDVQARKIADANHNPIEVLDSKRFSPSRFGSSANRSSSPP